MNEVPDSNKLFLDDVFVKNNEEVAQTWVSLRELYPNGVNEPLLPDVLSREQFAQGNHYECFMLSALATLVRFPDVIRNCFVTKKPRRDGRYTFQFFRGKQWVKVEIDDRIALEDGDVLYMRSPTEHWWPLLLEKAYAKFYTAYDHLEGCTLQETFHDLTGNPVLNIPMDAKLAKAAGVDIHDGRYWLSLGHSLHRGHFAASVLTRNDDLESMGLQSEQQYGVLNLFSLTGSAALDDIVVHMHNPFEDEEYDYSGPLNRNDKAWTIKLRAQYPVDDRNSIFMPLRVFLKIINSMQLCYLLLASGDATYYDNEWKGETAGGNPIYATWRNNPLLLIRNTGSTDIKFVIVIKQEDQRRFNSPDEDNKYVQCGVVLTQYNYPHPIPTYFITGNNHKAIFKSLFLNSREVANTVTIPPNSMCYLVPSTINRNIEAPFTLGIYRFRNTSYENLQVSWLAVPGIDWANPAKKDVHVRQKEKDRVDFYVDEETDVHILLHQTKPFVSKSGGDAMTEDYMGMYLYDDTDRRISGVHAATNFREVSIIHHVPRSGRFAVSITCPRAKSDVTAYVTVVASGGAHVRIVDPPEDATMFDDEDEAIDEGDDHKDKAATVIDYDPFTFPPRSIVEVADSATPFEDKRFYMDNKNITNDPWVHIGDLYPEGKTQPLLPDVLSREQFAQGEHFECCCLAAFAALIDHHPGVIRNCFVTKKPRRDGRYTFQFFRYGQWVKVEIDDRIPQVDGNTLYCRSPTHHWWPLLLEKAYAKFYTMYQNLEGCTLQETFHDFTGRPVVNIPMDVQLAQAAGYDVRDASLWTELNDSLRTTALAALTQVDKSEALGLQDDQSYAVLGFVVMRNATDLQLSDILVKLYNPFVEAEYTGPMNKDDTRWPSDLRQLCRPETPGLIYMPVDVFVSVFLYVQQLQVTGPLEPCWNFNSEWGDGTNGGNPTMVTWRQNPLYVVRNTSDEPLQLVAMIRQPDQRHMLHRQINAECNYIQCGVIMAECTSRDRILTYLITGNNHRIVHKGLFLNSREVADVVTVPANSLCYLVPSAMQRDKGKFMLSFWYTGSDDARSLSIERLNLPVARHLPAIGYVTLQSREKARVDFVVDVPTQVHVLVRQEKAYKTVNGGDAMAEDFVAMYLYNDKDQRMSGTTAATNFREIGVAHTLPKPGRYAVAVTCPRGNGNVPCRIEIVGVEAANVRTIDAPEKARVLGEVDLAFLDPAPQGVPLADIPLDNDGEYQQYLDALRQLHDAPGEHAKEIAALERALNAFAHDRARGVISADRPKYLPHEATVAPVSNFLNTDKAFTALEQQRYQLKKLPRSAPRLRAVEEQLRALASEIAETARNSDLGFLDAEYEGIPTDDLQLMDDASFAQMAQTRGVLMRNPEANALNISKTVDSMHERARELARAMHARERAYLDREPEGVPLELLPLNEDDLFSRLEDELRALKRQPTALRDARAIKEREDACNTRAHALAAKLKADERELFLDPQPLGIALCDLPLDDDAQFHQTELQRLHARRDDPLGRASDIKAFEDALNERARELARQRQSTLRGFLDPEPFGIPLERLGLEYNDEYMRFEEQLAQLLRNPSANVEAVRHTQNGMRELVHAMAAASAARDRQFLEPEIEGRLVTTLPLDEHAEFAELDARRRRLRLRNGDADVIRDLEDRLNDIAHTIAHALNVEERPDYLAATFKGIPFSDLPLDDDQPFRGMEVRRQELRRDTRRNSRAIQDIEDALNERAMRLAEDKLASDRAYLDAHPEGVPLALLPLNSDEHFVELEGRRALLKKDMRRNAKLIAELEGMLNDHAHELARQLKAHERGKFLQPRYCGIALEDLPLDGDQLFHDMEVQRLTLKDNPARNASAIQDLEDAMNDRANELATQKQHDERIFLDPAPLGVPLHELQLNANNAFLAKEEELRRVRADPRVQQQLQRGGAVPAAVRALQDELRSMAKQLAAAELTRSRAFLDPEPEGRAVTELPLNDDAAFRAVELEYRELRKDPKRNAQRLADLEDVMNEHVHRLARELNAQERGAYLEEAPHGVPLRALPLDADEEFCALEAQRVRLMRQPDKNASAIAAAENALAVRARELAREKIRAERAFLDPEPQGVPLKYLPLDHDTTFQHMEAERTALRGRGVPAHDTRLRALEASMQDRAAALARDVRAQVRGKVLPPQLHGVETTLLPLEQDMPFADLEGAYIRAAGDGDPERATDLADAMVKRAQDMAQKLRSDVRAALGAPLGYTVDDLDLDHDPDYLARETAVMRARAAQQQQLQQPQKPGSATGLASSRGGATPLAAPGSAAVTSAAEAELAAAVLELAKRKAANERFFLDEELEGRRVDELPLNDDPTYRGLEDQYRRLAKDPYADADLLRDLEQMMNDRAHELARQKNAAQRRDYLPTAPRNVPLSELPLDTDKAFNKLEAERARLCRELASDGDHHAASAALRDVEDALRSRADALAQEALQHDRMFLDDEPEHVHLRHIDLDGDAAFQKLEQQRAALKAASGTAAAAAAGGASGKAASTTAIRALEQQMNERLHALAREVKAATRAGLQPDPQGIPLRDLAAHLDKDAHFRELEDMYRDVEYSPARRAAGATPGSTAVGAAAAAATTTTTAQLLAQMDERAREVADALHAEERKTLAQCPHGIPLEALPLNSDRAFLSLENEARALRAEANGPRKNAGRLEQITRELNERALQMASEERQAYCDAAPEGVPLEALRLGNDVEFVELEAQLRALRSKKAAVAAAALAAAGGGGGGSSTAAAAGGLAGIGGSSAALLGGAAGGAAPATLSAADQEAIAELEYELNRYAHAKARALLRGDRAYLDPRPAGVEVAALPLDSDDTFRGLEAQRARLKAEEEAAAAGGGGGGGGVVGGGVVPVGRHRRAIADLEAKLNARATVLAEQLKAEELAMLEPDPLGVPYDVLAPHEDGHFNEIVRQVRALKADDPRRNAEALEAAKEAANSHVVALARALLEGDRDTYLDAQPEGVPLQYLPLDSDPAYHKLEVERAKLKARDALRNRRKIDDLAAQLNARAHELAAAVKRDELRGLDAEPEGVPLEVLDMHSDAIFASLAAQLRSAQQQLRAGDADESHAEQMQRLVDEMNERAHAVAHALRTGDRAQYVEAKPRGVPASILPLDTDPQMAALEVQRATLKARDARRNANKIKELDERLRERVLQLAEQQRQSELACLDAAPHGVPVALLELHSDPTFARLVEQHRELAQQQQQQQRDGGNKRSGGNYAGDDDDNDEAAADALAQLQQEMNERADELAAALVSGDRESYLDPEPQGVPLRELPLDSDGKFHALEVERAKLKAAATAGASSSSAAASAATKNTRKIKELEEQLNNRVHELAQEQLRADLDGIDAAPHGVPLDLLKPHSDAAFASLLPELRKLKQQMQQGGGASSAAAQRGAPKLREHQAKMNARVGELAREHIARERAFLGPRICGLPVSLLPLDTDRAFADLEQQVHALRLSQQRGSSHDGVRRTHTDDVNNDTTGSLALARSPRKHAGEDHADVDAAVSALRAQMRQRAGEVAKAQHARCIASLDPRPAGVPVEALALERDDAFCDGAARLLSELDKRDGGDVATVRACQAALEARAHAVATALKARCRSHLRAQSHGLPLHALALDASEPFAQCEAQLRAVLRAQDDHRDGHDDGSGGIRSPSALSPTSTHMQTATGGDALTAREAALRAQLQQLADEVANAQLRGARARYLGDDVNGIALADLAPHLDGDDAYMAAERERALLVALDSTSSSAARSIAAQEDELRRRAGELAQAAVHASRDFLPREVAGVPRDDLPLDTASKFRRLEEQRLRHLRNPATADLAAAEERELRQLAEELAAQVRAHDVQALKHDHYRGIPVDELPLHDDAVFRDVATRLRRARRGRGVAAPDVVALEDALEQRVCEIADDVVDAQRACLDPQPEGMPLADVPLDGDVVFAQLEAEHRRRVRPRSLLQRRGADGDNDDDGTTSPSTTPQQREAVRELVAQMNARAHALARDAFARRRVACGLDADSEGVPLADLGLDDDVAFKQAEVAHYALSRRGGDDGAAAEASADCRDAERRMRARVRALARAHIAADRAFLDPAPRGVPLDYLPLDRDNEFVALARERRRCLHTALSTAAATMTTRGHPYGSSRSPSPAAAGRGVRDAADVCALEAKMNARAAALADKLLAHERAFLTPEPRGVPLHDLPLSTDVPFHALEVERLRLRRSLDDNAEEDEGGARAATTTAAATDKLAKLSSRMNERAEQLADELLTRERAFLDPAPYGIPLRVLPLNSDAALNVLERRRRHLRREAAASGDGAGAVLASELHACEAAIARRVGELAQQFIARERAFLDPTPAGVPLRYLPLSSDKAFAAMEAERRALLAQQQQQTAVRGGAGEHVDDAVTARRVAELERDLNDRAAALAREWLTRERAFLDAAPRGVPLDELPLDDDDAFGRAERQRWALRYDTPTDEPSLQQQQSPSRTARNGGGAAAVAASVPVLERQMNERARALAEQLLTRERAFLDPAPEGVPLHYLDLDHDAHMRSLEQQRRRLRRDRPHAVDDVAALERQMDQHVRELARRLLAADRSTYLDPAPHDVPLRYLPLDRDAEFRALERDRLVLKADAQQRSSHGDASGGGGSSHHRGAGASGNDGAAAAATMAGLEARLRARAEQLAEAFVLQERAFLDPQPEGVPLRALALDADDVFHGMELQRRQLLHEGARPGALEELEALLNRRVRELARAYRGWRDDDFHAANEHVAEQWVRVGDLLPASGDAALDVTAHTSAHVDAGARELGYLAPFIAALGCHPVLLQRLLVTTSRHSNGGNASSSSSTAAVSSPAVAGVAPYTFLFFDSNSNPVYVDIDDRVPCDAAGRPKFTQVTGRAAGSAWWPLLLEKAYAKFVGGYAQLDNCTPHETLHDLTGRPVRHIPFERKLADAIGLADYTTPAFWRAVAGELARGDVFICLSNDPASTSHASVHPQCTYALLGVVEATPGTASGDEVVLKLHNAYRTSSLNNNNGNNNNKSRQAPRRLRRGRLSDDDDNDDDDDDDNDDEDDDDDVDALYLPLPVFLANFSSMQRCHVNCGDRLTTFGAWTAHTAGGNPKYTTFRNNPIYLVENKGTRPASILAELRHSAPSSVDADGLCHYPQTGLALLLPLLSAPIPTPLITNSTHRFLQKGMMLDSREMCTQLELPPNSTCYLVPYTMHTGEQGAFQLSVYPGQSRVTLTALQRAGLAREPVTTHVMLSPGEDGRRVDFLLSDAADVHVLLRQDKVSDPQLVRRGDAVAEDDVVVTAYDEQGVRVASSGDATNAREHSCVLRATRPGRYSLLATSPNPPHTGNCPCTISLYVPKRVTIKFIAVPAGAAPLQPVRFPTLPRTAPTTTRRGGNNNSSSSNYNNNNNIASSTTTNSASNATSSTTTMANEHTSARSTNKLPPLQLHAKQRQNYNVLYSSQPSRLTTILK